MTAPPPEDRAPFAPLLALAAVGLGHAIQVSNGNLHPEAVTWLTVALGASTLALVLPALRWAEAAKYAERLALLLLGGGLIWQFAQLTTAAPAMYLRPGPDGFQPLFIGAASAAVLAGA